MGKYQDLFRNVALGLKACTDESVAVDMCDRHDCPYHPMHDKNLCTAELVKDKASVIKIMTYLDKLDGEVKPI